MTVQCDTFLDLDGRYTVVALAGELNHESATKVRHHVRAALDVGLHRVVVDAAAVNAVDNAGVGTLCALSRQAEAMGGWLRVAGLPGDLVPVVLDAADTGALQLTEEFVPPRR